MKARVTVVDQHRWERFWRDLATLGEIGAGEARLLADAGRRALALNWEHERSPDGVPWVKLAKRTQRERRKLGFASKRPILRRTGDLRGSFTDADHPRNIYQVGYWNGGTVIVIGARENPSTPGRIPLLDKGGINSEGAYVPARPFIGFSDQGVRWLDNQSTAIILQRVERLGS